MNPALVIRTSLALLTAAFLAVSLNAADSGYEQGLEAYNKKDYPSAARAWDAASKQGSAAAKNGMGLLLQRGLGVEKNQQAALTLFREAAQSGYGLAEYNLGLAYHQGLGVTRNDAEATKWLELAASHGVPLAELSLGNIAYAGGSGDTKQALRWWQSAAQHGVAVAGLNAGYLYAEGKGVPQDYREAARWYEIGAKLGNSQAQYALGLLYRDGKGVKADTALSAKWLNMASRDTGSNTSRTREVLVARDDTPVFHKVEDSGPGASWSGPTASGFVVRQQGGGQSSYVVTSLTGRGCANLRMRTESSSVELKFIAADEAHGLSLLGASTGNVPGLALRTQARSAESEPVVDIGFDLDGARAIRNAVSGVLTNRNGTVLELQASKTAPSRGGVVLDARGAVIGLVPSSAVNSVLGARDIAALLDSNKVAFVEGDGQGIDRARQSVVLVECRN